MKSLFAAAAALFIGLMAAPAFAEGLFDDAVSIAPVTKFPAGSLFGSLLAASAPTAECTCTNCKCANCGCSITTVSEEEVIQNARAADQQRYVYTTYADGSFRAVPRAASTSTATTTRTTTAYEPVVVTSEPVCANGRCHLPSATYASGGASYTQSGSTQSSYSYSGDSPYQATSSGRSGFFGRRRGGGGGFRLFRGGCASGQRGR